MPFRPEGGLRDPEANRSLPLIADDLSQLPISQSGTAGQWGYQPLVGPLFNTDINPHNITQGNIGDCFLLAALLSILEYSKGQEYINDMMCDLGDSVVVRLYKIKPMVEAVYYRVHRTRMVFSTAISSFHLANWVHILEKVYAYHRRRYGGECFFPVKEEKIERQLDDGRIIRYYKKDYQASRAPNNLIEALTGGHGDEVYQFIFGRKAQRKIFESDVIESSNRHIDNIFCSFIKINPGQSLQGYDSLEGAELDAIIAIFGDQAASENAFMIQDFLNHVSRSTITTFIKQLFEYQTPRFDELIKLCELSFSSLHARTYQKLIQYISRHVPRKRGTGDYTFKQNRYYNQIAHMLCQSHLMSVATTDKIGRVDIEAERRAFTGENMVRGLVGKHAYQIIDCYERVEPETNIVLKFLLVRNPWGYYSRRYGFKQHEINPYFFNIGTLERIYSPAPHVERVLHAERADIPPTSFLTRALSKMIPYRYQPIPWPRRNSAMHISEARLAQFFEEPGISEIELCDFMKRFDHLYSVIPPWVAP